MKPKKVLKHLSEVSQNNFFFFFQDFEECIFCHPWQMLSYFFLKDFLIIAFSH